VPAVHASELSLDEKRAVVTFIGRIAGEAFVTLEQPLLTKVSQ